MANLQKLFYCSYSNTIRISPQNYLVATFKKDTLLFDSWDGAVKDLFDSGDLTELSVLLFSLRIKFGRKIQDIINNYGYRYPVVTMDNAFILWASRKGFVRVVSATQQEWTARGIQYFFGK